MNAQIKEKTGKIIFTVMATVCIVAVAAIFVFMTIESLPALKKIGFFNFVFGSDWSPDRLDKYDTATLSGSYGIFKMIVGTVASSVGSLLIGGTLGYFTAVFTVFYCPQKLKRVFSSAINLLAGIPSVVYGFFGITFLLPLLSEFAPNNGSGLLATSLILGIMITPTVVSLSKTSLEAVPKSYYEGALALGANRSTAVFKTVTKAARSGIVASLVLGIGRALGETMAVVMVAGNSVAYPNGLFNSFRVLTANIVIEMGYAGEVQKGALVATGVILLLFVVLINLLFGMISKKATVAVTKSSSLKKKIFKSKNTKPVNSRLNKFSTAIKDGIDAFKYKIKTVKIFEILSYVSGIISATVLLTVIGFILAKGAPYLISNPSLIYGKYQFASKEITVLPSIVTTLMTVGLSLLISVPIGISTAVYLTEYSNPKNPFVKIISGAISVLNGVPSIVYGLFGMIVFVPIIKGTGSILSGCLTVSIMLLPTVIRSTEESLKSVENSLREGSFALGAGKLRTIFKVVIPSALPGIVSAVILSMGRIVAESAPFIYTMGSVISATPTSYLDSNATLAVALYTLSGEGWYFDQAYATAVILIVLVLGLNLLAEFISTRLSKKLKGDID